MLSFLQINTNPNTTNYEYGLGFLSFIILRGLTTEDKLTPLKVNR